MHPMAPGHMAVLCVRADLDMLKGWEQHDQLREDASNYSRTR